MHVKFVLFLVLSLAAVLGMHYVFFRSLIHFFHVQRTAIRIFLYAAMVLLAFSFITAFILLHWRENAWSVAYYKLAATWMGFLIHALVAVAAVWLMVGLGRVAGRHLPEKPMALIFLAAAATATGYGMWAAFHPVVRDIAVPVRHLPAAWRNRLQ